MPNLTEKKKADRIKMAELVRALAVEMGLTAEVVDKPFGDMSPHMIMVKIRSKEGLKLHVDFDGKTSQPDVHVLSWHMDTDVDTRLADAFGDINRFHYCKATDIAYGTDELLRILAWKFLKIQNGTAFSPEREAAHIAKNGTAAERKARFDAYMKDFLNDKAAA